MAVIGIYTIAVRNIETGKIDYIKPYKENKNENDLIALDKEISKYDSKQGFLRTYNLLDDEKKYDIYVFYRNHGVKFYDIQFKYKLNADIVDQNGINNIDKLINNIVWKGLTKKDFVNTLDHQIINKFAHYEGDLFEYNNLRRFVDLPFPDRNQYGYKIESRLKEEYPLFRKIVDYSYRFKNPDLLSNDDERKKIDYPKTISNFSMPGQITIFDIPENLSDTVDSKEMKVSKMSEEFINTIYQKVNDENFDKINDVYFEIIDKDDSFFYEYISNSKVNKRLINNTNKYLKSIVDDIEAEGEYENVKSIIKMELSKNKNKKEVIKLIKDYSLQNNPKLKVKE